MSGKVAILQSNYIPWKGYFDIVNSVDLFIFHDDLQYTKNDWRNRNKIKTPAGLTWLTVPCGTNEKRLICDVALNDREWQRSHWNLICRHYSKAPFFEEFKPFFEEFYLSRTWTNLSEMNQHLIRSLSTDVLGASTRFADSRDYHLEGRKAERVLELLQKAGAESYLSGPSAKSYLNELEFEKAGIGLLWMDYSGYPEYPQFHAPFEHGVSIIDLLFHTGPGARQFMKSFRAP